MKNDRITFRIPPSLLDYIENEMQEKGISMSDIIRESLLEHFGAKKKNEDVADVLKGIRDILHDWIKVQKK